MMRGNNIFSMIFLVLFSFVGLTVAGCQVVRGERTVSQYTNDSAVTAKVKSKLVQSDQVSATRVSVETDQGVVLLSGFVADHHQAIVAQRIASKVNGVRAVRNRLVVSR